MQDRKAEQLKRLSYIEGHLRGVRKMVEEDKYCVEVLRQTYAIRKSIQKLEAVMLEGHLRTCVPAGIREGREEAVVNELLQLFDVSER